MIVLDCEQGSRAWLEARAGIPTASQFSRIVTPSGKPSAQAEGYVAELLAEHFLGPQEDDFAGSEWVERGRVLEPVARRYYAFHRDVDPQQVGFCGRRTSLEGLTVPDAYHVGASPDALVGDDGLLELKVPMPKTHLLWLARGGLPRQHVMQVQGQLWVTGRAWCDFLSWHPDLPPVLVRVEPDPKMQAAFDEHLQAFVDALAVGRDRLIAMGVQPFQAVDPADPFAPSETVTQPHEANRKGSIL